MKKEEELSLDNSAVTVSCYFIELWLKKHLDSIYKKFALDCSVKKYVKNWSLLRWIGHGIVEKDIS